MGSTLSICTFLGMVRIRRWVVQGIDYDHSYDHDCYCEEWNGLGSAQLD